MTGIQKPLAFVDIETTGGSPQTSRVLEIAVIKQHPIGRVETFQTLLNPDEAIPSFITNLTGITEANIVSAPYFNQIAFKLYDFLSDSLFVAHNVNFDLSFIASEFRRLGVDFMPTKACTVRLARSLYPGHKSYRLDAIIDRHQILIKDRHRAMADAQAIADFYTLANRELGTAIVSQALLRQTSPVR